MRHRKATFKIGRTSAHRRALLGNQVSSLILHGEIRTTVVKAKETRRIAEKMVTMGKLGDLHHRRLAIAKLRDEEAVRKLFAEIAPRFAGREGGYTRIIRLGVRLGDAAEMCLLQWVDEVAVAKPATRKKASKVKAEAAEAKAAKEAPEKAESAS
jgi:large subunit ribosomal protein L17